MHAGPVVAHVVLQLGVMADVHDGPVAEIADGPAEGVDLATRHRILERERKVVRGGLPGLAVVIGLQDAVGVLVGGVLGAVARARVVEHQPVVQLQDSRKFTMLAESSTQVSMRSRVTVAVRVPSL